MNTIYEWLLHNTGNEANYYTILNCQRSGAAPDDELIRVMGRLKIFDVLNLIIVRQEFTGSAQNEPMATSEETHRQQLQFVNEQAVIHYLSTGEMTDLVTTDRGGIRVMVDEPSGETGAITFPAEQPS